MLHRLADGLTTVLSSALWMGAGIKGDKASGAGRQLSSFTLMPQAAVPAHPPCCRQLAMLGHLCPAQS